MKYPDVAGLNPGLGTGMPFYLTDLHHVWS